MRSLFFDIARTVDSTMKRVEFTIARILKIPGISRSWYYQQIDFHPMLDRRFNPFAAGNEEWIVTGYKRKHPGMSFREVAYSLIDEYLAYLSPSTVYNILKKHGLITKWKMPSWASTRPEKARKLDERWQTDIMYVKIRSRFFYLIIFIDEYSRYIVHHSLLTSMDADSFSFEAQNAINILRKGSVSVPVMQSDNGSSFISMEFKIVLKENRLTQKLNRSHTPEQNGIVERANKTVWESPVPVILTGYDHAKSEIAKVIDYYNNKRRHSSLHYLTSIYYYRGDPDLLLAIRESKIEKARTLRKEENMRERKGGAMAGSIS